MKLGKSLKTLTTEKKVSHFSVLFLRGWNGSAGNVVQTQRKLSTHPVSAAICRVGLLGLPELEPILAESRGLVYVPVHSSGFFTARIAM